MTRLRHIEVVIPARNEEEHIAASLRSVRAALQRVRGECRDLSCDVTVVLDCCTDGTAALVAAHGARGIVSNAGCVGGSRHIGAIDAITRCGRAGIADRELWITNTDADSTVPDTWLVNQVLFGDNGIDAVLGTVTPCGLTKEINGLWHKRHLLTEGHDHVHGANMGMRASTYLQAGGFAPLTVHEDRDLADRLKSVTNRWISTHRTNVTTSGRTNSRVVGGFATYLATMATEDQTCV